MFWIVNLLCFLFLLIIYFGGLLAVNLVWPILVYNNLIT